MVRQVFSGHANVQSQGSTAKGTSLKTSDWDFYVHFDNTLQPATNRQRLDVRDLLSGFLVQFEVFHDQPILGANRISLTNLSLRGDALPDVDIIFEKFKADFRPPPNNGLLADSHISQQAGLDQEG